MRWGSHKKCLPYWCQALILHFIHWWIGGGGGKRACGPWKMSIFPIICSGFYASENVRAPPPPKKKSFIFLLVTIEVGHVGGHYPYPMLKSKKGLPPPPPPPLGKKNPGSPSVITPPNSNSNERSNISPSLPRKWPAGLMTTYFICSNRCQSPLGSPHFTLINVTITTIS